MTTPARNGIIDSLPGQARPELCSLTNIGSAVEVAVLQYYIPGISYNFGRRRNHGWLLVNDGLAVHTLREISRSEYDELVLHQMTAPILLYRRGDTHYWIFQNKYYWDDENLTPEEVYALLVAEEREQERRRKARIERAMAIVAMGDEPRSSTLDRIPDDVKQHVWLRDEGKCVNCGSTTELQYDHIIPRAKGGTSSDPANIQILCAPCNRRKSDGLTIR